MAPQLAARVLFRVRVQGLLAHDEIGRLRFCRHAVALDQALEAVAKRQKDTGILARQNRAVEMHPCEGAGNARIGHASRQVARRRVERDVCMDDAGAVVRRYLVGTSHFYGIVQRLRVSASRAQECSCSDRDERDQAQLRRTFAPCASAAILHAQWIKAMGVRVARAAMFPHLSSCGGKRHIFVLTLMASQRCRRLTLDWTMMRSRTVSAESSARNASASGAAF